MKNLRLLCAACAVSVIPMISSCEYLLGPEDPGTIALSFEDYLYTVTKATAELPDTSDFILNVYNSKGESVYSGRYGDSPENIIASPGSYTVEALSCKFSTPKFSSPQYGDRQVVVVKSGQTVSVKLLCVQQNAGIRLKIASNFLTSYPDAALLLKSDDGKLVYSYTEKRIAYFNPGNVSLVMSQGGTDQTLFTRNLAAQEVLTVSVNASGSSSTSATAGNGISIQLDTTCSYTSESFTIGKSDKGNTSDSAYSVSQAKDHVGDEGVWVYGYIVAGDLTSTSADFDGPFTSRTHLAIAARSSVTEKESCLSVQLTKGDLRDELNLVDNPDNLGRKVYLKGDVVDSYYGIPGIQNISDWSF